MAALAIMVIPTQLLAVNRKRCDFLLFTKRGLRKGGKKKMLTPPRLKVYANANS